MTVLWWIVETVLALVVVTQLTCVIVALYEMLNLPETHDTRLTAGAVVAVVRDVGVEIAAMLGALATTPLAVLPWRKIPPLATAAPPLVLVPGYATTRACLWPLRWRLAQAGWPYAVGYDFRTIAGDVRAAARGLGELIDSVRAESGAPQVVVIAHGLGGIVARLCLRERVGSGVLSLVTLGTPHQGSKLYVLALDPMLYALRAGSALVEELADDDPLLGRMDLTTIYSSFDATVVPSVRAQYPGASNIEVEGVGHFGLLWSRRVFELVRENLDFVRHARPALGSGGGADQGAPSVARQRPTSSASE